MSTAPFVGYPGRVWGVCWQALSWLSDQLAATSSPTVLESPVTAVFETLWNGLAAISAWQTSNILSVEAQNLVVVQSLPLGLDPVTATYLDGRATSCAAAASGIAALVPPVNLLNVGAPLSNGQPVIADPMFLEWCMTFNAETPPAGTLLPSGATDSAQAWLTIVNAIVTLQGNSITPAYDTAARQYRCSSVIANILSETETGVFSNSDLSSPAQFLTDDQGNVITDDLGNPISISTGTEGSTGWSTTVALPVLLLDAASLASPATLAAQQISVIRYVIGAQIQQLAKLLLSFRSQNISQPSTANLRNTESLMDLAARTTGDFENWINIAALNKINPPYPGPTNPALALTGKALFTAGTGVATTRQPTYEANVLGTDYDFGPINSPQPFWLGDIPLITGYLNFARAIGRRLQTSLGTLIYHPNYGCSIPPELGGIQSTDEAKRLAAYGRSAIQGDPRTGTIVTATATVEPGFEANFSATIIPAGFGSTPVFVNETIGASP